MTLNDGHVYQAKDSDACHLNRHRWNHRDQEGTWAGNKTAYLSARSQARQIKLPAATARPTTVTTVPKMIDRHSSIRQSALPQVNTSAVKTPIPPIILGIISELRHSAATSKTNDRISSVTGLTLCRQRLAS